MAVSVTVTGPRQKPLKKDGPLSAGVVTGGVVSAGGGAATVNVGLGGVLGVARLVHAEERDRVRAVAGDDERCRVGLLRPAVHAVERARDAGAVRRWP